MPALEESSPEDISGRTDQRQQQLESWLRQTLGIEGPGVAASSDASFRRYFRYQHQGQSVIAMDAPPATEDCRPFVQVAELLAAAGVTVPTIIARDLQQGFLLLSDLGPETYLQTMQREGFEMLQAEPMFAEAMRVLIRFQAQSKPGLLPDYDEALLRRELELFPEWYLARHLGYELDAQHADVRACLDELFQTLIKHISEQARVFVHRDFMPRNLMTMPADVGVLDFQDAVYGPISYDPVCLFKDAFISWPEEQVTTWLLNYWQQAQAAGLPVPDSFEQFQWDCDVMSVQRHLKVIGIFARICHRDGKPHYLQDVPRFIHYLQIVAQRRPELCDLTKLLDWVTA